MYFFYTGRVNFAPLRSKRRGVAAASALRGRVDPSKSSFALPASCSPKSLYRLCSMVSGISGAAILHLIPPALPWQLNLDTPKALARAEIRRQLSAQTIVEEVFSRFSSSCVRRRQ